MTILAASSPGELRVAAVAHGQLVDYALHRPGAAAAPGAVFRGRVTARAPAMAGVFMSLGPGAEPGFLPDSAGGAGAAVGTVRVVRVVRAAQGGKGPRLAALADAPESAGAPGCLAAAPSAATRLASLHAAAPVLVDDAAALARLRPELGGRLRLVPRAFDDEVEAQVAALGQREVAFPGGGRLVIEPTSALVAIDVDLGAAASGRHGKTAAHVAANEAAIAEIARQLRLRSLGGPIVVDLAGLSPRRRAALAPAFERHLAGDPAATRFLGFSALGLAELLRPRTEAPLHEALASAHGAALAALRALAREVAAAPWREPELWAAPDVVTALVQDVAAMADLQHRCGRPARTHQVPSLPPRHWSLAPP